METNRKANKIASSGSQFPAATFPETFKDFFSMINEDEDQVELVSNVLEDKVIPRYNVRGRNRSSSAKYSNTTSLLPSAGVAVRSNSFRVNRTTPKHQNVFGSTADNDALDRSSRNHDFSDGRFVSLGSQLKFNELNTNNYSNFSDDEKSMKFNRKFSADANIHPVTSSVHNKSQQPNYDGFENRKCNCGKF
ncbi:CLUMA_CG003386, isoform A, partial [Clunio marinus]